MYMSICVCVCTHVRKYIYVLAFPCAQVTSIAEIHQTSPSAACPFCCGSASAGLRGAMVRFRGCLSMFWLGLLQNTTGWW